MAATRAVDVIFLYEHIARELDVACVFKALAAREEGLSVEIVHFPCGLEQAVRSLRPRVVLLPYCYNEHQFYTWRRDSMFEWQSAVHINLTWEQLLYPGNREAKSPKGDFALRNVIHHVWTSEYADSLVERGTPRDHIFLNGHLAYGLYMRPYREYFPNRAELAERHGLDPNRRWLFYPENYGWAFYTPEYTQWLIQCGANESEVHQMREYCTRCLEGTTRWLYDVAAEQDVEVIIRPRPATPLEAYKEAVVHLAGPPPASFHITKAESVREWILASDQVLSSYSTTLIEAALADKPIYMCEPLPLPPSLAAEWHSRVPRLRSFDSLSEAIQSKSATHLELQSWARGKLLSTGDPIRNLVRYVADVARGDRHCSVPSASSICPPGRLPLPPTMLFAYRRLKHRMVRDTLPQPDYSVWKDDVLPATEIAQQVAQWERALDTACEREKRPVALV